MDTTYLRYHLSKKFDFLCINRVVKDLNGEIVAGILSKMYCWNCLYIDTLWVKEDCRKEGLGSKLLKENHWQSILFTRKIDEYSLAKYKLTSNGIKVKTKIINNRERGGIGTIGGNGNEYYGLYVKNKDIEMFGKIIHSR